MSDQQPNIEQVDDNSNGAINENNAPEKVLENTDAAEVSSEKAPENTDADEASEHENDEEAPDDASKTSTVEEDDNDEDELSKIMDEPFEEAFDIVAEAQKLKEEWKNLDIQTNKLRAMER